MKYHYQFLKRINKLGVLITQFLVTVILVVKKIHNIVYLILSIKNISYKLRIYCSTTISIKLDLMFKATESSSKAFGDYLSSLNSPEIKQDKDTDMSVDPPTYIHETLSLLDNSIALGTQSERLFDSNLILVSGFPFNITRTDLDNAIEIIARMFEFHFKHEINWNLLEAQTKNPIRKELTIYSDGDTFAITIPLLSPKTFSMGGHNTFPPAFGLCVSMHLPFSVTCQAMPSTSLQVLKKGLELAIFRGIPSHEAEAQCILSLLYHRLVTHYAPKLNHPIDDFDIVLLKRSPLNHCHREPNRNLSALKEPSAFYVGIYIRPGNSLMVTLKSSFGLRQGPNPFACHWIGEIWDSYASLQVTQPSKILLDRTPVTSIVGFETMRIDIADIIRALLLDNPSFPLFDVAYLWVEKIDAFNCTFHIVWKLKHHSVFIGNNLLNYNNETDLFIRISAIDNPNMVEVRSQIAESLAHFRLLAESPSCDWNSARIRQQWSQIVGQILKTSTQGICSLRLTGNPVHSPTESKNPKPSPSTPSTELVVHDGNFPRLVAPVMPPSEVPTRSLVPHRQEEQLRDMVAQMVSSELSKINEASQLRDQQRDQLLLEQSVLNKRMLAALERLTPSDPPSTVELRPPPPCIIQCMSSLLTTPLPQSAPQQDFSSPRTMAETLALDHARKSIAETAATESSRKTSSSSFSTPPNHKKKTIRSPTTGLSTMDTSPPHDH